MRPTGSALLGGRPNPEIFDNFFAKMLLAKTPDIFETKVFENKLQNSDSTFNISLFLLKVKVRLGQGASPSAGLRPQRASPLEWNHKSTTWI